MLHGEGLPASSLCCTKCADGVFKPCGNQSLRNLRLNKGESEFGGSLFSCVPIVKRHTLVKNCQSRCWHLCVVFYP